MTQHTLRDLAKFAAGLVLADFIVGWWLLAQGLFPVAFLGMTLTAAMAGPWLAFDAALFFILVHYGWDIGTTPHLKGKTFLNLIGIIFGAVALVHLVRLFFGLDLTLGNFAVPLWLSWLGVAATSYLSYMSFYLARRAE